MPEQTPTVGMERKLAAIFSTDVAGYSRLMGDDEEATIRTLTSYRALISSLIQRYRGRVVDAPGDNLLAEFASVVDALRCAVEIQHVLTEKNTALPDHRQMQFRIGINLGDVIVEGERLYGDGVNIAARLESLATPGGICISGTVYDQVETKLALQYEDQGEQTVKNIAKPVRVYRVKRDGETSPMVGAFRTDATPAALPLRDKPSLIVLPFVNMSKDPDQEYFSDGLTEVLTGDLSRISSLFVIARNSAFTYKGKAVKAQEVGREMGVRYVLEGSVQKANQQVRIAVQLIEAATSFHVWSERYDRPLTDIFALQDEIVRKIITTLKLQLTLEEQGTRVRKHTNNIEAYDYYLRGLEYFLRFTKEANAQAQQMYEKALALDPQYAEAYASLSNIYYLEWTWGWSATPQTLERALALAQQAVGLDDSLPLAHSVLSYVYAQQQQYEQAIAEGERALTLDPNRADSYAGRAEPLNFAGRSEEALKSVQQAMRLNPHYPSWYLVELGWACRFTGRYAEAITTLQELLSRSPNFITAYMHLAGSYLEQWLAQQGPEAQGLELAKVAIQRTLILNDSLPWNHLILGYIFLYQQQYEQALAEMQRFVTLAPNEAWSSAALALVLGYVGRSEEALDAVARAPRLQALIPDRHLADVGFVHTLTGRYAEAVAPLQQYLIRYPNMLPAHVTLAIVYNELGQAVEAQKEAAEVLRLNPKFSLSVHRQRTPIKDPAVLERYIAALRKAGLK